MDIHRCRFVPYNPQAINALAFSHPPSADLAGRGVPTLRLAIGRANGDIEIWNPMRGAWFQETVLRGGRDRSIEGLAWTLDPAEDGPDGSKIPGHLRLFSIGYSSAVTEWDIEQGRPMRHSAGNYGEIWCLAPQPRWQPMQRGKDGKLQGPAEGEFTGQHIAAGCADGSIVILSTADSDLKFLRLMRPSTKRARVLSVTFQDRNTIVAGYADSSIRLFDIRNGQLLRTVSLGKGPAGGPKELLVWSVKCLPDGTIVSGDSAGEIRFWDAKNYSLVQRIQGHLADTLDVAVSSNGDTVVSGGADQRTVVYRKKDGDKNDKRSRWAEIMHRRYHTHDVKSFAVYETKDVSFVVSGGPDATPVVLPLREFGKEHHRKLPSLPQVPQLASSPSSRLVMTFWDREISIWRVTRGPATAYDNSDGQRHRLVGKVLIQGEENITSAMLSADGKLLVIATISGVKVFSVRRRKGDEKGALRIQKLDVPSALSEDGARLVTISPDSRWLCIVRPNSDIHLARVKLGAAHGKPEILSQMIKVNRAERHTRYEKVSHGTLAEYERTIRCVSFSEGSKILASGDLSGCVDTWVLENAPDTASTSKAAKATESDDEPSDDEDEELLVLEGQRWQAAATESPIPRLKSGIALLSFRPKNQAEPKRLTNGTNGTSQNHATESRLMVLTSEHQLAEFDALEGKLTDWSRRNPKAYLPAAFRGVKDRAMGCLWDLSDTHERLWLYGTSWLWMFDLNQDFPSPEEVEASSKEQADQQGQNGKSSSHKRKRESLEGGEDASRKKKPNSGAGDRMSQPESAMFIGSSSGSIRKIVGSDESNAEWVSVDETRPEPTNPDENGEDEDEDTAAANDASIAQLRRQNTTTTTTTTTTQNDNNNTPQKPLPRQLKSLLPNGTGTGPPGLTDTPTTRKILGHDDDVQGSPQKSLVPSRATPPRRWWHTYKYRDILGIVPLSPSPSPFLSASSGELDGDGDDDLADGTGTGTGTFEVVVIERPMWDVELPGRYLRDYE